jgi:hypothetical protein
MALHAINPATGETLAIYKEMPLDEVRNIIDKAHKAYLDWRRTSFRSRAALMRQAAQVLRSNPRNMRISWPRRWANRCERARERCKNAHSVAITMRRTPSGLWPRK